MKLKQELDIVKQLKSEKLEEIQARKDKIKLLRKERAERKLNNEKKAEIRVKVSAAKVRRMNRKQRKQIES
jgi:hypothetical protein